MATYVGTTCENIDTYEWKEVVLHRDMDIFENVLRNHRVNCYSADVY